MRGAAYAALALLALLTVAIATKCVGDARAEERAKQMTEFSIKTFGKRIRAVRSDARWSPAELSRRAEVNQSTVYRVEEGQLPNLSLKVALQLAAALEVGIEHLCRDGDT